MPTTAWSSRDRVRVTIAVTARNDTTDDYLDAVDVELQAPLADRSLIDAATGHEIVVDDRP
jgi:hypothetical protein